MPTGDFPQEPIKVQVPEVPRWQCSYTKRFWEGDYWSCPWSHSPDKHRLDSSDPKDRRIIEVRKKGIDPPMCGLKPKPKYEGPGFKRIVPTSFPIPGKHYDYVISDDLQEKPMPRKYEKNKPDKPYERYDKGNLSMRVYPDGRIVLEHADRMEELWLNPEDYHDLAQLLSIHVTKETAKTVAPSKGKDFVTQGKGMRSYDNSIILYAANQVFHERIDREAACMLGIGTPKEGPVTRAMRLWREEHGE